MGWANKLNQYQHLQTNRPPLKRSILFLLVLLLLVAGSVYFFGPPENLLSFYGVSGISIFLFLLRLFFPDELRLMMQKIRRLLGVKRRGAQKIIPEYNFDKKKYLLQNLKEQVYKRCKVHLNLINETEVKYITELNWRLHTHTSKDEKKQGSLLEVLRHTQKFSSKSFAVIGDAGVGKTSAIYNYLLQMLEAEETVKEEEQPIPVYFSLSSLRRNQPFKEWLLQEFKRIYHLDKIPASHFLSKHKVFPFLDGLDQMSQDYRDKCFEDIYDYSRHNPIAITSRPQAFKDSIQHLKAKKMDASQIFDVYELRPLSSYQIKKITSALATKETFRDIFDKSPRLKSFVRFPMALQIVCVIIKDLTIADLNSLENGDDVEIFHKLWQKYDAYVFKTERDISAKSPSYSPTQLRHWLKNMALQGDSFFIEEMQPMFLSSKAMRLNYYFLSRLPAAFLLSIAAGFFLADPLDFWDAAVLTGLSVVGVIWLSRTYERKYGKKVFTNLYAALRHKKNTTLTTSLMNILLFLFPLILVLGVYYGFTTPRSPDIPGEMRFNNLFSSTEAIVGILIAILMAMFFGIRYRWQKIDIDIRSVERIRRDWRNFLIYGFLGGTALGLFLIPAVFLFRKLAGDSTFNIWLQEKLYIDNVYLFAFMVGSILGFFLAGLTGYLHDNDTLLDKTTKKKHKYRPNYGMRKSFVNALKSGVLCTIIMASLFGLVIGGMEGEITSVIKAVKAGIAFGILGFLWFGGLDVLSHYCLRIVIFLDNSGPLNYLRFLEEASQLRFVKPVGSGYEFMHPTLKDYFATGSFNTLKKSWLKRRMVPGICFLVLIPIIYTVTQRFTNDFHWQDAHGFELETSLPFLRPIPGSPNELLVSGLPDQHTKYLELTTHGRIRVGTFLGYMAAGGTEAGFLGMGVGNTFDYPDMQEVNHGALVLRKKGSTPWVPFPEEDVYGVGNNSRSVWVNVQNNDTLEFKINDREWQNNTGIFYVSIDTIPKTSNTMQIISHRGAAGLAPENTLEGIQKALELRVEKIEIDIHQTRDNQLVVMHDQKVDRTTNGKGKIQDLDLRTLKALEIKSDMAKTGEPLRIPDLDSVLKLISASNTKLLIEIKYPESYPGLAANLVQLVKKHRLTDQVEVFSFDKKFIRNFKKNYPDFYTGIFVFGPLDYKDVSGIDAVGVYYHSLIWFPSFKDRLKAKQLDVFVWNINSQRSMQRLIKLGVDGIITDRPELLKATLGN